MNDYPIVLAHGIARFDFLLAQLLRNASLLGRVLESSADGLHYFREIARHLRNNGFDVAHTSVSFAAGVEVRAGDLQLEIENLLRVRNKEKAHIIAHSMGGLDARHMIFRLNMAGRVASLTTIGTPHFGTTFADWGIANQGHEIILLLKEVIDLGGFNDLTTEACRLFNEEAETDEADNGVFYQTYASSERRATVFAALQPSWDIIESAEGANDGLVSRNSQFWAAGLRGSHGATKEIARHDFPVPADHLNEIGWWDINQLRDVNLFKTSIFAAIRDYELAIRNVYLDIARRVQQL